MTWTTVANALRMLAALPATVAAWLARGPAPTAPDPPTPPADHAQAVGDALRATPGVNVVPALTVSVSSPDTAPVAVPQVVTPATVAPSHDDLVAAARARLVAEILHDTESVGPFPVTGGVIHADSREVAEVVASELFATAPLFGVRVSDVASLERGESDFDPGADDPNDQLDTPGETPLAHAEHADEGLAQEDVATALGDPANKGKSLAQVVALLLDPAAATTFLCRTHALNMAWAANELLADASLVRLVPGADPRRVLAFSAYNHGQHGALTIARAEGPSSAGWAYGVAMEARAASYVPLFDVPA